MAAGTPAEQPYPGIAAHLRGCDPCGEDFEGLLVAARGEALTSTRHLAVRIEDRVIFS